MLNKKNVANNWKEIVKVFNSTRETNPNITANQIEEERRCRNKILIAIIKKWRTHYERYKQRASQLQGI